MSRGAYTRSQVRYWLDNWGDTFDTAIAETSFAFALVKADLIHAANEQSPPLRLMFRLFCIQGWTFRRIALTTGWPMRRVVLLFKQLVDGVHLIISDDAMYTSPNPPPSRCETESRKPPMPTGYAPGGVSSDMPIRRF